MIMLHHHDLCCFLFFPSIVSKQIQGKWIRVSYIAWKFSSLQMGCVAISWHTLGISETCFFGVIQLEYSWYSVLWVYITCIGYMYVRYTYLHWLIFMVNVGTSSMHGSAFLYDRWQPARKHRHFEKEKTNLLSWHTVAVQGLLYTLW